MLTGITAALRQGARGATADNEPPPPRGQHPERRRSTFLPPCRLYGALLPRGRAAAGARGRAGRSGGTVRGTPGRAPPKPASPTAPPGPRPGRKRARETRGLVPSPASRGRERQREGNRKSPESRGKALPARRLCSAARRGHQTKAGRRPPPRTRTRPRVRGRRAALPCSCHSPWLRRPPVGGGRDPRQPRVSEQRAAGRRAWGSAGRQRPGTSGLLTRRAAGRGAAHHPRPAGRAGFRSAAPGSGEPRGRAAGNCLPPPPPPPPHVRYSRGARAALGLVVGEPRRENYSSRRSPRRRPTCSARPPRLASEAVGERGAAVAVEG